MQTYNYKFDPTANQTSMTWMIDANLFVYESGKATVDGSNLAVIVKPDNGAEIQVKPGQRFRLAPGSDARMWSVRLADPTVTLQASFVIGSGEFDDANTVNTFKLDGTFTNTVRVNNTTADRIPVTLDTNQVLNIAGSLVNYTNSFADISGAAGLVTIFTPAQNVNGIIVELSEIVAMISAYPTTQRTVSMLAKAGVAPTGHTDGDVLQITTAGGVANGTGSSVVVGVNTDRMAQRIKVAAGKGLYYWQDDFVGPSGVAKKMLLSTVL